MSLKAKFEDKGKIMELKPKNFKYGKAFTFYKSDEERFEITPWKWECGWYFGGCGINGYNIYTRDQIEEFAEDTEPEDYGIVFPDFAGQYFDYGAFREDILENDLNNRYIDLGDDLYEENTSWLHITRDNEFIPEYDENWIISKEDWDRIVSLKEEIDSINYLFESSNPRTQEQLDKIEDKLMEWADLVREITEKIEEEE